jgi:hypothetical protein
VSSGTPNKSPTTSSSCRICSIRSGMLLLALPSLLYVGSSIVCVVIDARSHLAPVVLVVGCGCLFGLDVVCSWYCCGCRFAFCWLLVWFCGVYCVCVCVCVCVYFFLLAYRQIEFVLVKKRSALVGFVHADDARATVEDTHLASSSNIALSLKEVDGPTTSKRAHSPADPMVGEHARAVLRERKRERERVCVSMCRE